MESQNTWTDLKARMTSSSQNHSIECSTSKPTSQCTSNLPQWDTATKATLCTLPICTPLNSPNSNTVGGSSWTNCPKTWADNSNLNTIKTGKKNPDYSMHQIKIIFNTSITFKSLLQSYRSFFSSTFFFLYIGSLPRLWWLSPRKQSRTVERYLVFGGIWILYSRRGIFCPGSCSSGFRTDGSFFMFSCLRGRASESPSQSGSSSGRKTLDLHKLTHYWGIKFLAAGNFCRFRGRWEWVFPTIRSLLFTSRQL